MRRILSCAFAITVANAIVTPASAQSVLETLAGIKFCRTLKDDGQRLKCFDGLFAEKPSEQPSSKSPDVEVTWTVTESKSPIDDSPQVTAILAAIGSDAQLVLRCKERDTDVMFGGPLTYLGSGQSIKVLVRIDDAKPIETMWLPSTGGQAVFAPSAIQFIRALSDKGKLFVRAFGYGGKTVDGEFQLGNVSDVRQKIALACNWPGERAKGSSPQKIAPAAKPN